MSDQKNPLQIEPSPILPKKGDESIPTQCHRPPKVTLEYEKESRRACMSITGKTFCKTRPRFLRNPETGRNLELDGYCEELKLAFEYDGDLHSHFPNAFHRTKEEFDRQQKRDQLKNELCKVAGIRLVRIPHTLPFDEIESYICKEFQKCSILSK